MKKYLLKADVYKTEFELCIGTREEWKRYREGIEQKEIETPDSIGQTVEYEREEKGQPKMLAVWIPEFKMDSRSIGILVHELLHATFKILDNVGVERYRGDSNEAYAYLLEHLVEQAIDKLSKHYL